MNVWMDIWMARCIYMKPYMGGWAYALIYE